MFDPRKHIILTLLLFVINTPFANPVQRIVNGDEFLAVAMSMTENNASYMENRKNTSQKSDFEESLTKLCLREFVIDIWLSVFKDGSSTLESIPLNILKSKISKINITQLQSKLTKTCSHISTDGKAKTIVSQISQTIGDSKKSLELLKYQQELLNASQKTQRNESKEAADLSAFIERAKKAITYNFFDEESARFRNIIVVDHDSKRAVCGEVNAKNSLGAYAGYREFAIVYNNESRFERPSFGSPVSDKQTPNDRFSDAMFKKYTWDQLCIKNPSPTPLQELVDRLKN